MAKVKVIRQSGNAVDLKANEEYGKEFKEKYDAIQAKCGLNMQLMHEKLIELDEELSEKYEVIATWELPKSKKAWMSLVEQYGSFMVSTHVETGEVILAVLDIGI